MKEQLIPASRRLPAEVLSLILSATSDWELCTTLSTSHSLPVSAPWVEQATILDRAILISGTSLKPVERAIKEGHTHFTQWGSRCMIRFSYLHLLSFFLEQDPRQLKEECGILLPVVASAWGRTDVLRWAMESGGGRTRTGGFDLRPDKETMAEAMDEASRHGQVEVLEFWKNSGLPLHYSEHALASATIKRQIGSLEWWKKSGLPLKIGKVLDFASMEGSTTCLDWWANSGLTAPYSKAALYHLSRTGNIPLLTWWFHSPYPLKFDKEVLIIATKYGQTSVLTWWEESGLDIEFRWFDIEEALEDSFDGVGKEAAGKWWEERGYVVQARGSEWTKSRCIGRKF